MWTGTTPSSLEGHSAPPVASSEDRIASGFASQCGAKNPEYLQSAYLRKHVATLSQILNLQNHELDQLADFLGHDIWVRRDLYRLPEAAIEMAKISKVLLAMDDGSLARFQGKSLDEIEIEGICKFIFQVILNKSNFLIIVWQGE